MTTLNYNPSLKFICKPRRIPGAVNPAISFWTNEQIEEKIKELKLENKIVLYKNSFFSLSFKLKEVIDVTELPELISELEQSLKLKFLGTIYPTR